MQVENKEFYLQFFLIFVLFFFTITYIFVNKDTISEQIDVLVEGSSFFAKTTTYSVLNLSSEKHGFDKKTYEIELLVFEQINEIREDNNLGELKWDPMLGQLARVHSLDMVNNNYFNHTNIIGQGPTDRAKLLGIKTHLETEHYIYEGVGENIGFMPKGVVEDLGVILTTKDVASAMVLEWMLSERHKDNILKEDYMFTGVGVAYDGKGNYYLTQNFQ